VDKTAKIAALSLAVGSQLGTAIGNYLDNIATGDTQIAGQRLDYAVASIVKAAARIANALRINDKTN
jgi:hypothetical protein